MPERVAPHKRSGGSGVRRAELVMALSLATDFGMGQPMEWALRSCLLGLGLGEEAGLGEPALSDVYYLSLLHYIGCTADSHGSAEVFGDEISAAGRFATLDAGKPSELAGFVIRNVGAGQRPLRRARTLASTLAAGKNWARESSAGRCEVAEHLAERLGLGVEVRRGLWQLFERWDGKGLPAGAHGDSLTLPARVVRLAREAETFHRLGGVETAVAAVRERSGGAYDPWLAERFCSSAPRLLTTLERPSAWEAVLDNEPGERISLSEAELEEAARVMADFADLKSPYFSGHSRGVAELAAAAAERCGLPAEGIAALRQAGLLHDLGRVGVPTGVWDKPGALNEGERERVRLHPYYTERILARPEALASLGNVADLHHERMDGSGYHRGLPAPALSIEARVLAAADAYHAMTEPRPHRPALTPEAAADELRREVRAGRIDGGAAEAVLGAAGHRAGRARRREWPADLSDREVEVLRLLSRGLSNRQIAGRLYISPKTVGHHVEHIYAKISVTTRPAATLFAIQHGLLTDAPGTATPEK